MWENESCLGSLSGREFTPESDLLLNGNVVLVVVEDLCELFKSTAADGAAVCGRSIVWLQNKRDAAMERLRGPSPRREDAHEFRVGRLKHERVCVPRDDSLLDWAMQVMKYHGERKAVLEVCAAQ